MYWEIDNSAWIRADEGRFPPCSLLDLPRMLTIAGVCAVYEANNDEQGECEEYWIISFDTASIVIRINNPRDLFAVLKDVATVASVSQV